MVDQVKDQKCPQGCEGLFTKKGLSGHMIFKHGVRPNAEATKAKETPGGNPTPTAGGSDTDRFIFE